MPAITTTQWAEQFSDLLVDQGLALDDAAAFATAFAGQVTDWLGGENAIPAALGQSLSAVLTNWNTFTESMVDFLTVSATGGPHADGTIDVVDYLGVSHTIAGLAKLAEDLALAEEALEGVEILLAAVADAVAAASSAAGSASAAATSASAAAGSATSAATLATAASGSATAALASQGAASGSASASAGSATAAAASATAAAGSASAAATARTGAEAARDAAEEIAGFDPTLYQLKSAKGADEGYAGLDVDGDVPAVHLGKATKAHVGLPNVDNTSDLSKPISTATQAALDDLSDSLLAVETTTEDIANTFRSDILRLYLNLAEIRLNQVGTPHGIADTFEDQDGVDLTASSGEVYDASGKWFHGDRSGYEATESLPAMTANNAPAGHFTSASNENSPGQAAWKAADDITGGSNIWATDSSGAPWWWRRQTPTAIRVAALRIHLYPSTTAGWPTHWSLQGSNDGSTWTGLDAWTGEAWGGVVGDAKVFEVAGSSPGYTYHRLLITAVISGSQVYLSDIELLQPLPAEDMDLRSAAFTAYAAPTKASLLIAAKSTGSITPGTDLIGSVSRDDGDTWTVATLTARETAGGFTFFEALAFDISGQPSGTEMRWRVETSGDLDVGAVVMSWS